MQGHREHCRGDLPWDDFFTDRDIRREARKRERTKVFVGADASALSRLGCDHVDVGRDWYHYHLYLAETGLWTQRLRV
ncbi:hypothetical protein BDA96_02G304500 [Sorghum bicolor]|uniref:Uncharacterized protein n=2 Tax=Sorghum bicolor TaxID=4558 RepID=A0A921UWZ1_SORBI|nr:hypothetical protein BDA96_02G303500 [Sorghum bicolor]KAG0544761.1 hypothetical protein BDA96_02G304500 [Sorghum bicolor]OQU89882.1 hypothetical protein SORBI_3002G289250 [Sorghum bicolor]